MTAALMLVERELCAGEAREERLLADARATPRQRRTAAAKLRAMFINEAHLHVAIERIGKFVEHRPFAALSLNKTKPKHTQNAQIFCCFLPNCSLDSLRSRR